MLAEGNLRSNLFCILPDTWFTGVLADEQSQFQPHPPDHPPGQYASTLFIRLPQMIRVMYASFLLPLSIHTGGLPALPSRQAHAAVPFCRRGRFTSVKRRIGTTGGRTFRNGARYRRPWPERGQFGTDERLENGTRRQRPLTQLTNDDAGCSRRSSKRDRSSCNDTWRTYRTR